MPLSHNVTLVPTNLKRNAPNKTPTFSGIIVTTFMQIIRLKILPLFKPIVANYRALPSPKDKKDGNEDQQDEAEATNDYLFAFRNHVRAVMPNARPEWRGAAGVRMHTERPTPRPLQAVG